MALSHLPIYLCMCLAGSTSALAQQVTTDEQGASPAPTAAPAIQDPAPKVDPVTDDAKLRAQVNQLAQEIAEHDVRVARLTRLSALYTEKSDSEKVASVEELKKLEDARFEKAREAHRLAMPKDAYLQTCQAMRDTGEAKAAQKAAKSKARNATSKEGGHAKDASAKGGAKAKKAASSAKKARAKGVGGKKAGSAAKHGGGSKKALAKAGKSSASKHKPGARGHGAKAKKGGSHGKKSHARASKATKQGKGGRGGKAHAGRGGHGKAHGSRGSARGPSGQRIAQSLNRTGKGDLLVGGSTASRRRR